LAFHANGLPQRNGMNPASRWQQHDALTKGTKQDYEMKYISSFSLAAGISGLLLACAADPGTKPHDMSTAQHEAMAQNEEAAASGHAEQHEPTATQETTNCSGRTGCWTSASNPTAQHADDAARHRDLAQKHRAAAAALVTAEARACSGLAEDDRDTSPFYHREDIVSVAPYNETVKVGKGTSQKEVGATVVFRAVPGMTAEWLQRVVDCHLARSSALGHQMPDMDYCPLMSKGAKAQVTSVGNGFAVNVFADDAATVAEIKKRAFALKSG
jgi:hypothetical protein